MPLNDRGISDYVIPCGLYSHNTIGVRHNCKLFNLLFIEKQITCLIKTNNYNIRSSRYIVLPYSKEKEQRLVGSESG